MKKRRILLVDDEASITRALALYLTENGNCDVRVENVGSRAVAAAREFRPDLIFMDIVMPDADDGGLAARNARTLRRSAGGVVKLRQLDNAPRTYLAHAEGARRMTASSLEGLNDILRRVREILNQD